MWDPNGSLSLIARFYVDNQEGKNLSFSWFAAGNQRVKIKESEKINWYLDLARELKKLQNIKVLVIALVVGVLGMVFEEWSSRALKKKNGIRKQR